MSPRSERRPPARAAVVAAVVAALVAIAGGAARRADAGPAVARPQLQADLGLSVIGVSWEAPVAPQFALGVEVALFGTYFLPVFNRGDNVVGIGAGLRPTWFAHDDERGLYVTPYARLVGVEGSRDGARGTGMAYALGAFVGWAFEATERLDVRVGGGVQYLLFHIDTERGPLSASTPFVALDLVIGLRR